MYGGNTKYHVNPYIQGTTVPCDITVVFTTIYFANSYIGNTIITAEIGTSAVLIRADHECVGLCGHARGATGSAGPMAK